MKTSLLGLVLFGLLAASLPAAEIFVEAESFKSEGGWVVQSGPAARRASGLATLAGGSGNARGTATTTISVKDAGLYRIWVRYASHPKTRGPFAVTVLAGSRELGSQVFDQEFEGRNARDPEVWKSFDAELPEGQVTLQLSKYENKNVAGLGREVDCLLLTMDKQLVPNHLHFGAQTYARATLLEGHDRPAYLHVFADHYHAPWYQHYSLGKSGATATIAAKKQELLTAGQQSAWCNVTPMIYQDSGAMFNITARHTYYEFADRLHARLEFATAPNDDSIVRTIEVDNRPPGVAIFLPPNLLTSENIARLKSDREIAEETGRLADAHSWPTYGRKPQQFPFFVTAQIDAKVRDAAVVARERKTLDYFGFADQHLRHVGGAWHMLNDSYCQPDLAKMKSRAAAQAEEFKKNGGRVEDVAFAELMDEPTGQPLEAISKDPAYLEQFRAWLKRLGREPADLLVEDGNKVKLVTFDERNEFPALYYFSQRFRTRALGDFMATQRRVLEEAYGGNLPTLVNFSDGAIYGGNFYLQGVDYFELLSAPDQNAIWGEDWANLSSTYQCASFNVELMRAAARERGQTIGHHLIAHAGRKPWDVKLKATSEVARGVKILNNFCYGPIWATHEGGPYFRTHVWQGKSETWAANAEITREIGAVEDLLMTAMPRPAKVALLYSSASDIWTVGQNSAYGFDRMHTWLALAHAQVPVDVVSEDQAARGMLADYDVCYLSGTNLTRAAADKLAAWLNNGGRLWLTAGAAMRDEFNRPLETMERVLPGTRGECAELQKHVSSGKYLRLLAVKDEVTWPQATAEVLSVKQSLQPRNDAKILAKFKNGSPALICDSYGKGQIYSVGFLPGLAYVRPALVKHNALEDAFKSDASSVAAESQELLNRSANPWEFPAAIRDLILTPVREANVQRPIECDVPLVDVVYMTHEHGVLIPIANYTNRPLEKISLRVSVPQSIARVESAIRGPIEFRQASPDVVEFSLPLGSNDFVTLRY